MLTKIFIDSDHVSWDSAVGNMEVGLGLQVRPGRAEWMGNPVEGERDSGLKPNSIPV
jgi:hypothetical protein